MTQETERTRKLGDEGRHLPRYHRRQQLQRDQANVDKAVREATPETAPLRHELTKPGDPRKLRGIPCIARGVPGRSGPDPFLAVQWWPER